MFEHNRFKNPIIIKGNSLHSVGGIICIVMAIMGLPFVVYNNYYFND